MGRLVERFGPRLTGTVAALLYGSGILLTGLAVQVESLPLLYIGYGVVGGLGLGAGYVTPVSTIIALVSRQARARNRHGHYGLRFCCDADRSDCSELDCWDWTGANDV